MQPPEPSKTSLSNTYKFSQMSMDDFRLLSVLGRGHFGKVNFVIVLYVLNKLLILLHVF